LKTVRTRGGRLLPVLLVSIAAAIAGCGGDDNKSGSDGATTETQATQPSETAEGGGPNAEKVEPTAGEADLDRKPEVPKGEGEPPSELVVQDLIVGKGKAAKSGDTVSLQYVGILFEDGNEFDASWQGDKPGEALAFPLGTGQVIPGWDEGIVGMKEGGRRKLIIPPDLAYGAEGFPPDIPPNATLIFDVDLEKVGG
jgi:peptidylprolyl isomerase